MTLLENLAHKPPERRKLIETFRASGALFSICALAIMFSGFTLGLILPVDSPIGEFVKTDLAALIIVLVMALTLASKDINHRYIELHYAPLVTALVMTFGLLVQHGVTVDVDLSKTVSSSDSALVLLFLSIAVAALRDRPNLGLVALSAAVAIILINLVGQTYGARIYDTELSMVSLIGAGFLALAVAARYTHLPLVAAVFIEGGTGTRTRTFIAVGMVIPWACGLYLYRYLGVTERAFPVEALLIVGIMWSMFMVSVIAGHYQEKSDQARREAERQLAQEAVSDQLTGFLNRAGMVRRLDRQWALHRSNNVSAAIILMDIDHFKRVNDKFGHDVGDRVLRALGAVITPHLRREDAVGRWGGEEFLFVIEQAAGTNLHHVAERLRCAVSQMGPDSMGADINLDRSITASFGVSALMSGDEGYEDAIKRADIALYNAKAQGRNCVVFDPMLSAAS